MYAHTHTCVYVYTPSSSIQECLDIFHLHLSPSTIMLSCSDFHAPIKSATSHHHPFHQHMDTDRRGQPPLSSGDGWAAGMVKGEWGWPTPIRELLWEVINGLLPETSAAKLSIMGRSWESVSVGMMARAWGARQEGGHATTPYGLFIAAFCHYTIAQIRSKW